MAGELGRRRRQRQHCSRASQQTVRFFCFHFCDWYSNHSLILIFKISKTLYSVTCSFFCNAKVMLVIAISQKNCFQTSALRFGYHRDVIKSGIIPGEGRNCLIRRTRKNIFGRIYRSVANLFHLHFIFPPEAISVVRFKTNFFRFFF